MIKERVQFFRKLMMLADLMLVAAAFFLGFFLRDSSVDFYPLAQYLWLLAPILAIWAMLLNSFGVYDSFRTKNWQDFTVVLLRIAFVGFIVLAGVLYVFKISSVSRNFISFIFLYAAGMIIIEKIILMNFFRFFRRRGLNYRVLLIVGTGRRAEHFIGLARKHAEWGLRILGLVDEDKSKVGQTINGCTVIGSFDDFARILDNNVIDQVVFIIPRSWFGKIEDMVSLCELEGLKVSIAIDFFNFKISHARQTDLAGFPLITFESTPDKMWHLLVKRLADIFFSALGLVLSAPLFAVLAILIKATSDGPVFFRQARVGLNGRQFVFYKFRTMVKDAEEKQEQLLAHNEMKGPAFKMANDPRMTKVGRFLRRTSLDELPQLWNVLKGEMSLIGPRPPLPSEVKKYEPWQRRKLSLRPGISCLWQVRGRNRINNFDDWMRLDLEYIDSWSLWLDVTIFLRTIPAVLSGSGAK